MTDSHVCVSRKVIEALLAFASSNISHFNINGIGIDGDYLCATNGHIGMRMHEANLTEHTGKFWPRAYVEEMLAIAKARKCSDVYLDFAAFSTTGQFPSLSQVFESAPREIKLTDNIEFDPAYLAVLSKLGKLFPNKGLKFVSLTAPMAPLVASIDNCEVILMPIL